MAARDGDGAGDVLGLGERLKLMASRIDSKLRLFNEVVVEYKELKEVICDLANEKERLDQERHKSKKELIAANRGLAAATRNLAAVEEELAQSKEQLVAVRQEMAQKDEELNALRGQKSDDDLRFEKLEEKIVKEIKDYGGPLVGDHVVREIGKLDEKPFKAVFAELPHAEAEKNANELYSKWEKRVNNPSKWKFFKTVAVGGDCQDEDIDEKNKMLKELKMKGQDVYNSVVDALKERKKYNIDGNFYFLLWNYKEGRKATLEDCIDCLIAQRKELTFDEKKGSNRK
ncbi:hypothetical protein BS78_08G099000 [Paspalum vaginatum]|nr:hypothetical protein BS78_08G099000 [Paspalum vaginatum]